MDLGSWIFTLYKLLAKMIQAGGVKKNKFSPPRMPLAISSQRVNIWYHTEPHDEWKRVKWPVFVLTAWAVSSL